MTQLLHIFAKDARRLRLEILLSLIVLVFLTWTEWKRSSPGEVPTWYEVAPLVAIALVWAFMIVRLIQSEALVGDRQFWITRPYIWYQLLASKAFFVCVCVAVPLVISQLTLLILANVNITNNISGIMSGVAGAMLVIALPAIALATITPTLARWIMYLLGAILLMGGMAWLDSKIPNSHVPNSGDVSDNLQALSFLILGASGICLRYAKRHSPLGAVLIIASIVSIPLIMVALPYRAIIGRAFPLLNSTQIPFKTLSEPDGELVATTVGKDDDTLSVGIPIQISQVPNGTLIRVDGVMLSADGRWQSEWVPSYARVVVVSDDLRLGVPIKRTAYNQLRSESHEFRASLALSELSEGRRQRILTLPSFDIPEVGHCWLINDGYGVFACRTTRSRSPLTLITFAGVDSTCPGDLTGSRDKYKVTRSLDSSSDFSEPFSPVDLLTFYDVGPLCPGTPITFSTPTLTRQYRIELPLGRLRLKEQQNSFMFGLRDYRIAVPAKKLSAP